MTALRLEPITSSERLSSLERAWADLWERCPDATPFQSPEWLIPWWQHLGRGRLCTVAAWRADRLVGLAPLFSERYFGTPLRRLALLGSGNTDYLDVLLDPEDELSACRAISEGIVSLSAGWDFCDFQQLRPHSKLLTAEDLPALEEVTREQEVCPVLSLPDAADPFTAALPSRLRSNLRYYDRRIEREGGHFGLAETETIDEAMDALFRLHGARWRRRRLPGVFTSVLVRRFHREAARRFAARGWLRLDTLSFAGEIRAAYYGFHCRERAYYYAGGFDPDLARLSPGTVLIGRAIQQAASDGAREFDFLRGDEPYKYAWSAVDRVNRRRLLWRPGTTGALCRSLISWESRLEHRAKRFARWLQTHAAS